MEILQDFNQIKDRKMWKEIYLCLFDLGNVNYYTIICFFDCVQRNYYLFIEITSVYIIY